MDMEEARQRRLEEVRAMAAERAREALDSVLGLINPEDPLEALAAVAGMAREARDPNTGEAPPFNFRLFEAISDARADEVHTWIEVSEAMGQGSERNDGQRVRSRYFDNSKQLDRHRAAHGAPTD